MATKTNTTIERNGKEYKYFRITRTIGHENGKPIKKQFVGSSKKEAEEKYKQFLEGKKEKSLNFSPKTFGELSEYYITNILNINSKYSPGTRNLYKGAYKSHIKGTTLSKTSLQVLSPQDIQQFYNSLNINEMMEAIDRL